MAVTEIEVKTGRREEFVDITRAVRSAVEDLGIADGLCTVFCLHTTAGITINENADPSVRSDILSALSRMVPAGGYEHSEGNSPAHVKSTLVGQSITVPLVGGKPLLGTWQGIYFCEFDGPRRRRVVVSVTS